MAVLHKKKGVFKGQIKYYARTCYQNEFHTYQLTSKGKVLLRDQYGIEPKDNAFIPTEVFVKMREGGYFLTEMEIM